MRIKVDEIEVPQYFIYGDHVATKKVDVFCVYDPDTNKFYVDDGDFIEITPKKFNQLIRESKYVRSN
jgi:hypothetical protein